MPDSEILASISDINAYLEDSVVKADDTNTDTIQIGVSRIVRGYLSGVVPAATMAGWTTPTATPDIIREIAAMLIASQLFFDKTILTTTNIDERHWAQILYDRAMLLLQRIVDGEITIGDGGVTPPEPVGVMSTADFFPIDDTDRAFTMSMPM
jgi:hypothetical protein